MNRWCNFNLLKTAVILNSPTAFSSPIRVHWEKFYSPLIKCTEDLHSLSPFQSQKCNRGWVAYHFQVAGNEMFTFCLSPVDKARSWCSTGGRWPVSRVSFKRIPAKIKLCTSVLHIVISSGMSFHCRELQQWWEFQVFWKRWFVWLWVLKRAVCLALHEVTGLPPVNLYQHCYTAVNACGRSSYISKTFYFQVFFSDFFKFVFLLIVTAKERQKIRKRNGDDMQPRSES